MFEFICCAMWLIWNTSCCGVFCPFFAKEPGNHLAPSTGKIKRRSKTSFNRLPFQRLATAYVLEIAEEPCVALIQQVFGGI